LPRSKYTKVPGRFPPIEQIALNTFEFDDIARRGLIGLLPLQLRQLDLPENIKQAGAELPGAPKLKTLADVIVVDTENLIKRYLTLEKAVGDGTPFNPANVKAAIRKLRKALEPFVRGWVDEETASIVPNDLDERLARRERDVAKLRLAPYDRRRLDVLCQSIGVVLTEVALTYQVTFEIPDKAKFVVTALDYAGIEHSFSKENPSRFAARVFPKIKNST
jgi:hypothetical protein